MAGLHQRVNHQGAIWIKFRDHSRVFRQSLKKNWPLWRCDFGGCGRAFGAVAVEQELLNKSQYLDCPQAQSGRQTREVAVSGGLTVDIKGIFALTHLTQGAYDPRSLSC